MLPTLYALPQVSAESAQSLVDTITSPALWQSMALGAVRIVVIFALALVVLGAVRRLVSRWIASVEHLDRTEPRRQRAETIGNLVRSMAQYVIWPMALIMALSELNIDVGALLAGVGIAGLAIGFGAQTLVKDVIGGIFLLFDDIIHIGDLVQIGSTTGTVEEIGVRLVKVRRFDGELVMIPAGDIRTFGNKSVGWARAIVPLGLSYNQDVDAVLDIAKRVADDWADDNRGILLEDEPLVQSILDFGDSAVTARVIVQVKPGEQFAAERELRRRLKRVFDEHEVEIPFPQRTVHVIDGASVPPHAPKALADSEMAADTDATAADGADGH